MSLEEITQWLVQFIEQMGIIGLFIMTLIESTFIPIPAELTVIPAGYLVHLGRFPFWEAYLACVGGSVAGAYINYWIALNYGRRFLNKYGRYFLLTDEKLNKMERYFNEHGGVSVFTGRLLPGIKHYISFPAGLSKMPLGSFLFYCVLSGAIWMGALLAAGYYIGENEMLIKKYVIKIKIGLMIVAGLAVAGYLIRRRYKKKAAKLAALTNTAAEPTSGGNIVEEPNEK